MTTRLRIQSSKADSNTWESYTRSELKLESTSERQKRLTWAVEKNNWTVTQWSKVLFSDECTFWKSRSQSLEEEWRGTESMLLKVQCEVSTVSDLPGNAAIYQEILVHAMLPSASDLAPAHTAKGTKSWFNDHGVTVLDWPANSPNLNPIENL